MSSLETRKIEPQSSTTVTLGAAGDTVAVPTGGIVKTNTVKDAGGNTLFTSDGAGTLSGVNSAFNGSTIFISSQTISSSTASVEFTSGIDTTYDEYVFYYVNIRGATNNTHFGFNGSIDSGSNYNVQKSSTYFNATHQENGSSGELQYNTTGNVDQGTGNQPVTTGQGNDADECCSGCLQLFTPGSTLWYKRFMAKSSGNWHVDGEENSRMQGQFATQSAIDAIRWSFASGNIESGTIYLYGIT